MLRSQYIQTFIEFFIFVNSTGQIFKHDDISLYHLANLAFQLIVIDVIVIVITFYSPSCLGQETAKGPFGLRVKLPPAHLSTTHDGGFTLSL